MPQMKLVGMFLFSTQPNQALTSPCLTPNTELIPALQTSEDVTARSKAFAEACKKQVTMSADTPGFLANRILMPYINEAIICLENVSVWERDIDDI